MARISVDVELSRLVVTAGKVLDIVTIPAKPRALLAELFELPDTRDGAR